VLARYVFVYPIICPTLKIFSEELKMQVSIVSQALH
jgi:hypothetical protein